MKLQYPLPTWGVHVGWEVKLTKLLAKGPHNIIIVKDKYLRKINKYSTQFKRNSAHKGLEAIEAMLELKIIIRTLGLQGEISTCRGIIKWMYTLEERFNSSML